MSITNIAVFGAGAAGSGVLQNLVCVYPAAKFTVVDCDVVEQRNITPGTQPYGKADLNRPKAQAIQRIVKASRDKAIEAHSSRIESLAELARIIGPRDASLAIDAFDNAPSRNLFLGLKGYHVLHVGFSAVLSGEAVWDGVFTKMAESKADAAIDVCQMHLARPFIAGLTAMAAMAAARFIETGEKVNVYLDSRLKSFTF